MRNYWIFLILFFPSIAISQEIPVSQSYLFNKYLLNPATSGVYTNIFVQIIDRHQWLNVHGAPMTQQLNILQPITENNGVGLQFSADKCGDINEKGAQISFAHHLILNRKAKSKLSFGISISFSQLSIDAKAFENLNKDGVYDPVSQANGQVLYIPDLHCGAYYTSNSLFGGITLINTLSLRKSFRGSQFQESSNERIAFANMGYLLKLSKQIEIEPSTTFKISQSLNSLIDINLKVYYLRAFWVGVSFQTNATIRTLIGLKFNQFQMGYAFEYSGNPIYSASSGTHELTLGISIPQKLKVCGRRTKYAKKEVSY